MSAELALWEHEESVETTWGEIVELKYGKGLKNYKGAVGKFPVYGTNGPVGYCDKALCLYPSVIIGRKGAYRGVHYSDSPFWVIDTAYFVVPKYDINLKWVYYALLTHDINGLDSGSAIPSTRREDFYAMPAKVPPRVVQDAIVKDLDSLNFKIVLNRQINQTLEQIAQAIFKSWFVDFEPVKAKIAAREALLAAYAQKVETAVPTATAEQIAKAPSPEEIEKVERQAAINAISGAGDIVPTDDGQESASVEGSRMLGATNLQTLADLFPNQLVESELGEIPEGWGVKALDEVAHYQNGLALQKFRPEEGEEFLPVLKIAQLKAGFADGKEVAKASIKPSCIVDNGDVIFSWSASLLVDTWCGGKAALNQHLFKVTSKDYPKWLYTMWTKHHLEKFIQIAADKAVTMGHIKRSHLSEAKCAIPTPDLINLDIIESIIQKQIECRLESVTLSDLRDALLPKLLSGEINLINKEVVS